MSETKGFELEFVGNETGICDCCGGHSNRVWGFVHNGPDTIAAYFVGWTQGRPDHGAAFDLILGDWGPSTSGEDRFAAALELSTVNHRPSFTVVDPFNRKVDVSKLASQYLSRHDVLSTAHKDLVFSIVDAVYLGDPRIEEIREWSS